MGDHVLCTTFLVLENAALSNMKEVWIAFQKCFQSLVLLCYINTKVDHEYLVKKQKCIPLSN